MEYQKRILLLLLLKIFLVGVVTSQKNIINLENGAYSNILIAINKNVPENLTIIENLKTMFTSASQRLYNATKQHVYWGHIKILVPNTWSIQSQYQFARTENSQSANILVHSRTDDEPVVENFVGCGTEGTLMHLTPSYILDMQYREKMFGNTDSVLVRNWGYYRWGLFKEHYDGDKRTDPTYPSDGGTEGTRCSLKIKGNIEMPDGTTCQFNDNQSGDNSKCRFVPDTIGQTATASLLFGTRDPHTQSVNSVLESRIEEFCGDDASDPDNLHNPHAPNLMNRLCDRDSAWKVMTERTTDFQAGVQPVSNTTPVFEVIQLSSVRSVVLVLDISGSMAGNRFHLMIQSSAEFIMNVIPSDSKLGIVVFGSTSEIGAGLTDITDTASRERLVNALPLSTKGFTCIGCGISSGIEVLGSYAQGGYMLLLSDGGENRVPYIREKYDDIENSGFIIDTITISNAADQQMEDLSNSTSGISSFCSDTGPVNCLIDAFHSIITERPDVGMEPVPVQIYSTVVIIERDSGFSIISVVIDAELGNETVIVVTWAKSHSISIVLTGPDGTRVDYTDSRYHIDMDNKIVTINLPLAQEVNYADTPALAIYAQVQRDFGSVLNADVTAIISDTFNTTTRTLRDDGSEPDLTPNDGTYSAYFISFTSNGRYNVKVDVIGYDVAENQRRKRSTEVETAVEPSFMRTASGGVFKVQGYTPNAADILPPSRIQDLVYTSFSYDNSTVTLRWTAVGDDLDQGTAYNYELRYSSNFDDVRNNFSNSHEVTQDQLISGNLSFISPAGVIETVTISLPQREKDIIYYFAIRAWDEEGNGGDLSNIASLLIRFIPVYVPTTEPLPASVPTTIEPIPVYVTTVEPTGPDNLAMIIGLCCAVGVVIIVGAVILCVYFYRKKHTGEMKFGSASGLAGLPDVEGMHQNPTYDNPTFSRK
ncbi:calcium-activated chloride channel regulator 1-like [Strongylocentrotus purpuratus]|uniref:VWFA domain-containing protein n=1 Tax=Strongylocentrotus purpuratus TaxID=7668 RepID=A0A7M7T327_STRPU|nr:calcium-activated chloride channel regulator 1-like [Strongylocentrotus purpuratus]